MGPHRNLGLPRGKILTQTLTAGDLKPPPSRRSVNRKTLWHKQENSWWSANGMEKIGIEDILLASPPELRRWVQGSHQDLPLMKSLGVVALNYSPLCQEKKKLSIKMWLCHGGPGAARRAGVNPPELMQSRLPNDKSLNNSRDRFIFAMEICDCLQNSLLSRLGNSLLIKVLRKKSSRVFSWLRQVGNAKNETQEINMNMRVCVSIVERCLIPRTTLWEI